jgi:ABC-2 type transport system permease protein
VKFRVLVIAHKELLQLRRDRMTLSMAVMLPIFQLLLYGYGINTDVRHITTIVYDQDRSSLSRDLARRMEATGFYDLVGQVGSYQEVERALRSGHAHAALVFPVRFAHAAADGRTGQLQLLLDGTDPQVVASAIEAAASLVTARARELQLATLARRGAPMGEPPLSLEPAILYNPERRSAVNIVPGLIGILLTMTMTMFTSMALARERERGTMEQLIVSPVRSVELIVGKIAPYVAIGYVQMSIVLGLGWLAFRVPIVGSLPLLYALAFMFISANLAIGLFFSTVAQTQQQAMQMSVFFLLPNILLSGFIFPFDAMPRPVQWFAQALPLTHFLRIVRGVVLKGSGFAELQMELLWLVAMLLGLIVATSLRFQKKLG